MTFHMADNRTEIKMIPDDVVERAARAIDPKAWKIRDEDLGRRQEWDAGIKIGWGKTSFNQWANRFTGKSLKLARAALEAAGYIGFDPNRIKELADYMRRSAKSASDAQRMMAEAKSARQVDGGAYGWPTPEGTFEWEIAIILAAIADGEHDLSHG